MPALPGLQHIEALQQGLTWQSDRFFWTVNGSAVNFELHGDGGGESISYEQGPAVPEAAGPLTAAFAGYYGWSWRNRSEAPVTVTLRTGGDCTKMKVPWLLGTWRVAVLPARSTIFPTVVWAITIGAQVAAGSAP